MKKYFYLPAVPLAGGVVCFLLRLLQNRTGYEPDTGLPIPGSPFSLLVPLALILLAAVLMVMAWRLPEDGDKAPQTFVNSFSAKNDVVAALLVGGSLLWLASGALEIFQALPLLGVKHSGGLITAAGTAAPALSVFMGALTALSCAAVLPVISACRRGAPPERNAHLGNLLLVPTSCLLIRVVMTYRADSVNPALSVYYVEILALAFLVLGIYRTSSFAFHSGGTRRFTVYVGCSLLFCVITLADSHTLSASLLYLGGALLSLGFLAARAEALGAPPAEQQSSVPS